MSVLQWLQNTSFGQFIESSTWANVVLLCFHAVGMGIVVGIVWMLDLRVLGFPRTLPFTTFRPLMRLAWVGFLVNAASGILMFSGAGTRFIINADFQLKMLLIALGGLSAWALRRTLRPVWPTAAATDGPAVQEAALIPPAAKALALLSLIFWFAVILFGRQIAYTLARPGD